MVKIDAEEEAPADRRAPVASGGAAAAGTIGA